MGASTIGSAGVKAMMRRALEIDPGVSWVEQISGPVVTSDSAVETYPFIGNVPMLREWIGGRQSKDFNEDSITVTNAHFEATIPVRLRELNRDKTGLLRMRIAELAQRASAHWAKLISDLLLAAETAVCYDGQYFYDTDHPIADTGGTQSNDVGASATTATAPTPTEAQVAVLTGISQITSLLDDRGEPRNENATDFVVMTGTGLAPHIKAGLAKDVNADSNSYDFGGLRITQVTNVRLNAQTTKIHVFRSDSAGKAFLRQQEGIMNITSKAEGSDFEHDYSAHEYGIDAWRQAAMAHYDQACLVTLS